MSEVSEVERAGATPAAAPDESSVQYRCSRVTYGLGLGISIERDEIEQILIPRKFLEKAMAKAALEDLPFIAITPSQNRQIYLDIPQEVQQSSEHTPQGSAEG